MDKQGLLETLRKKGVSQAVIDAFAKAKREDFVPQNLVGYAYDDMALPVMDGSTLSQPSTVAFMFDLLEVKDGQKILEIGSGSGYALALLSEMNPNGKVYGIEVIQALGISSKKYLQEKKNVEVIIRNGSHGLPEFAPYDRIIISASCPECPSDLFTQLKEDGILVSAVKNSIIRVEKVNGERVVKEFPGFAFVPLVPD
jgi:protein-L-isoaspartate(D-aspartate) O-methyltransferase